MVNTVGSCENKHWQKCWITIKKSLVLTTKQRSLIIGSLLGDGTMRLGKNAINANFKIEHGLAQKDYVLWKYEVLKPWIFSGPKISYRYDNNRLKYEKSWWFRTIRHPFITEIYKEFYSEEGYRTGRKIIPIKITEYLNPFALAIWIMDDGSYSNKKIDISTYSFSLHEINILQKCLKNNFGIIAKYYRDRNKGYRMYFNQEETKKLVKITYPYISRIPSMTYKVGIHNPVTTGFLPFAKKAG